MPVPVLHSMEGQGSQGIAVIDCAAGAPPVAHQRPAPFSKGRIGCTYNLRALTPTHEAAIPEARRWSLGVTKTVKLDVPVPCTAASEGDREVWAADRIGRPPRRNLEAVNEAAEQWGGHLVRPWITLTLAVGLEPLRRGCSAVLCWTASSGTTPRGRSAWSGTGGMRGPPPYSFHLEQSRK